MILGSVLPVKKMKCTLRQYIRDIVVQTMPFESYFADQIQKRRNFLCSSFIFAIDVKRIAPRSHM